MGDEATAIDDSRSSSNTSDCLASAAPLSQQHLLQSEEQDTDYN
jgi:hypothetical protein